MAIEQTAKVICDGCGKEVKQGHPYAVFLTDNGGNSYAFHDYKCVGKWAVEQQKVVDGWLELAAAHKELHRVLAKKKIDPYQFMSDITPEGEPGAALEDLNLQETREKIAEVQNG